MTKKMDWDKLGETLQEYLEDTRISKTVILELNAEIIQRDCTIGTRDCEIQGLKEKMVDLGVRLLNKSSRINTLIEESSASSASLRLYKAEEKKQREKVQKLEERLEGMDGAIKKFKEKLRVANEELDKLRGGVDNNNK